MGFPEKFAICSFGTLVAIGCLVVQGDYTSSPDFSGEYNPQKVFRGLEKLYEGFFPQSASILIKNGHLDIKIYKNARAAMTRKEQLSSQIENKEFL